MKHALKISFLVVALLMLIILTATIGSANGTYRTAEYKQGYVPGVQTTAEQRQRIASIRRQYDQEILRVQSDTSLTQYERSQMITELEEQRHRQVLNELTPSQRMQFEQWWAARTNGIPVPIGAGPGVGTARMQVSLGHVPGVETSIEQRQRIALIRQQTIQQVQDVENDPNLTPQQKQDRIAEIQRDGHEQIMNVLTPEQRDDFNQWWKGRPGAVYAPEVEPPPAPEPDQPDVTPPAEPDVEPPPIPEPDEPVEPVTPDQPEPDEPVMPDQPEADEPDVDAAEPYQPV